MLPSKTASASLSPQNDDPSRISGLCIDLVPNLMSLFFVAVVTSNKMVGSFARIFYSKIFPWPLGGPWGTLGGPRENFRKFLEFSTNFFLIFVPEFSWIFYYYYYYVLLLLPTTTHYYYLLPTTYYSWGPGRRGTTCHYQSTLAGDGHLRQRSLEQPMDHYGS